MLYIEIAESRRHRKMSAAFVRLLFDCFYLYQICVAGLAIDRAAGHYDIVARLEVQSLFCGALCVIEQNVNRVKVLA